MSAGPWEKYAPPAQPSSDGPWSKYAGAGDAGLSLTVEPDPSLRPAPALLDVMRHPEFAVDAQRPVRANLLDAQPISASQSQPKASLTPDLDAASAALQSSLVRTAAAVPFLQGGVSGATGNTEQADEGFARFERMRGIADQLAADAESRSHLGSTIGSLAGIIPQYSFAPTAALNIASQGVDPASRVLDANGALADAYKVAGIGGAAGLAQAAIPLGMIANPVTRALAGGVLGGGAGIGAQAAQHQIAPDAIASPTASDAIEQIGIGALLGAMLGRGRAPIPERGAEQRLQPDAPYPDLPPPAPISGRLPPGADFMGSWRTPRPDRSVPPAGTVRVTPDGEAFTPPQGAQALGDAIQAARGNEAPQLGAPVVSVDRSGRAVTSSDYLAQVRQAQADAQAKLDAQRDRRILGITPDIERTQAPRWAESRRASQDLQDRQDAIDAQNGDLAQQRNDDAPPWWMAARGGEMDMGDSGQSAPAGIEPSPVTTPRAPGQIARPANADRRKWLPTGRKDSRGRDIYSPVLDFGKGDGLIHWLAANGGVNFGQMRKQTGVDPALLKDAGVMRPLGKLGMPAMRRNGGMTLEQAYERMAEDGWFPPADPSAPARQGMTEAADLIHEALNGREVFHPYEGAEQRMEAMARDHDEAMAQQDAEFARDRADMDEVSRAEAIQALLDERADVSRGNEEEALTLEQWVSRAYDAGAEPTDIIDATWDGSPAEQVRKLSDLISRQRSEGNGFDTGTAPIRREGGTGSPSERLAATGPGEQGGVVRPGEGLGQTGQVEEPSDLFPDPTPQERIADERRRRDAQRNGLGRDLVRPEQGDGELFAGGRPEQTSIPDAPAPEVRASSRDMFTRTRGDLEAARGKDQAGNGRQDRNSGPSGTGGMDAGGLRYRPDATPELVRQGERELDELVRRFNGSVLADAIARDFREKGTAQLVGRTIKDVHDFAALAQVYRNPLFETLHYIWTDDAGRVLGESAVSSRLPSSSSALPAGERDPIAWLKRTADSYGATQFYMTHNHPSGNPSPSGPDITLTEDLARMASSGDLQFRGHVVLDHTTYSTINGRGDVGTHQLDIDGDDPLRRRRGVIAGVRLTRTSELAAAGRILADRTPDNSIAIMVSDAGGTVTLATSLPLSSLRPGLMEHLEDIARVGRGYRMYAVIPPVATLTAGQESIMRGLLRTNMFREIITSDGRTLGNGGDIHDVLSSVSSGKQVFSRRHTYTQEQKEFMRKAGMAGAVDERTAIRRALDAIRGAHPNVDGDAFRQGEIDHFHGIKRAVDEKGGIAPENDPYLAAEMIQTASTMEAILRFGAPELHGGALRVRRDVPGLLDALTPVRDQMPQWLGWMVAGRAQVLKRQGRENAMSDADIQAGLSLAKGHEAEFKAAAAGYVKLKNAILDLAEHTGIIDPVARKAWDHAEYIPFYRDMDAGFSGPGTRQGLVNQSSGIRTLKGGESPLKDPLGNIIANFTRLMDASMKNRATLLAVDQLGAPYFRKAPLEVKAETIPLDQVRRHLLAQGVDRATIDSMPSDALKGVARMLAVKPPEGDDIVRVMRNGKAEYYHVDDPLLLRSLTAFNEGGTHWSIKPLVWFRQLLTAGATGTPEFILRNALRDTGEATVTSRDRFIPVVDTVRGAIESLRESELTQDLMMAGAAFHSGLFHTGNNEDTAKAIRRALRKHGMTDSAIERYLRTLINPKRLWDVYRSVSEATEMGSRVSLARLRLEAGATPVEAAHEAKDFLNFQRRGDDKFVLAFTKVIPFLNARVQGGDRLYRVGTTKGRRGKVAARLAVMALLSTLLYWWNQKEHKDAYDEIPDWDKDANWHIAPGTDHYLRIPKPFELGLVGGTLPERMYGALQYQMTNGKDGDRPEQSWDAFMHSVSGTLGINPIPQAAMPIVEDVANKDLYFDSPIESMGDRYKAPSDRYGPTTSPTMRVASKGMSAAVGEDKTISPKRLEHFWRGYTAGMGQYLLDGADWVTRRLQHAPETPDLALRDYPLIGTVARGGGPARSTRYVDEFYGLAEKAQMRSNQVKDAVHNGDNARARRLEKEWGWLLGQRQGSGRAKEGFMHGGLRELNRLRDQLSAISKNNAKIYESRTMSGAAKRRALDANLEKRNDLVRKAVRQIRERQRKASESR